MGKKRKVAFKLPKVRSLGGSWTLEQVNNRQRTPCKTCGCAIREGLRVKYVMESYPYPTTVIFCPRCARSALWRAVRAIKDEVRAFCVYCPKSEQPVQQGATHA